MTSPVQVWSRGSRGPVGQGTRPRRGCGQQGFLAASPPRVQSFQRPRLPESASPARRRARPASPPGSARWQGAGRQAELAEGRTEQEANPAGARGLVPESRKGFHAPFPRTSRNTGAGSRALSHGRGDRTAEVTRDSATSGKPGPDHEIQFLHLKKKNQKTGVWSRGPSRLRQS